MSKGQQVVVVFGPRTDNGARPPAVKRHDEKEKEVLADAVAVFMCGPCCGCVDGQQCFSEKNRMMMVTAASAAGSRHPGTARKPRKGLASRARAFLP